MRMKLDISPYKQGISSYQNNSIWYQQEPRIRLQPA